MGNGLSKTMAKFSDWVGDDNIKRELAKLKITQEDLDKCVNLIKEFLDDKDRTSMASGDDFFQMLKKSFLADRNMDETKIKILADNLYAMYLRAFPNGENKSAEFFDVKDANDTESISKASVGNVVKTLIGQMALKTISERIPVIGKIIKPFLWVRRAYRDVCPPILRDGIGGIGNFILSPFQRYRFGKLRELFLLRATETGIEFSEGMNKALNIKYLIANLGSFLISLFIVVKTFKMGSGLVVDEVGEAKVGLYVEINFLWYYRLRAGIPNKFLGYLLGALYTIQIHNVINSTMTGIAMLVVKAGAGGIFL